MEVIKKPLLCFLVFFLCQISLAKAQNFWSVSEPGIFGRTEKDIETKSSLEYDLDIEGIKQYLSQKRSSEIEIPLPDGSFTSLRFEESKLMADELAAKFPSIKTYVGYSKNGFTGRFDLTSKGFHGFLFTPEGTVYIDPINRSTTSTYQTYYRKDYVQKGASLLADDIYKSEGVKVATKKYSRRSARTSGTELRTYRIAITTTGEYTAFHGGTVADALSAIVTTLNRVDGIYEREVAISFELIADNDQLIYINPDTDPYTNGDASVYINEVQANIDAVIGAANYDIGHGFSTGAGGLAGPGPCTSSKATGVTGITNPIGDPFDVDFVAHEIGHQFSANHTFNGTESNCSGSNRNSSTAFEPGSGTTILAYAGICGSQNIQNNSDPFFHTVSYDEILSYSVDGPGNSCAVITSTGNSAPTVEAGNGGFTIPISTPFTLTGSGNDPDGDDLTYSWEQFDLGPAGDPDNPSGNAPIFRSQVPKTEPSRTFPAINDIINNIQTFGEILPDYTRSMTFRLTARDNQNGGGGVNYDEISFNVTDQAGPFEVTSFNTSTSITAQSNVEINWNVANTDGTEVDCQFVNILLSTDGGVTFPTILLENTLNDGTETVLIPDISSTTARIKVEAADNIFFDINDTDLSIVQPTIPDFSLSVDNTNQAACVPNEVIYNINIASILSFTDEVSLTLDGLEDGLTFEFSANPVVPGNSSILTISDTDLGAFGVYNLTLTATSGSNSKVQNLVLEIINNDAIPISIITPSNDQMGVPIFANIEWTELGGNTTYLLELATDDAFSNIVLTQPDLETNVFQTTALDENTLYYTRVSGTNQCGTNQSNVTQFTTGSTTCLDFGSTDTPVTISSSGTPTITSEIEVLEEGIISDINVNNLTGTHTFISDLTFSLESPSGTVVTLVDGVCFDENDFSLSLDDQAASGDLPCPPTDAGTYQPQEALAAFNGEPTEGTWTLTVFDSFNQDGGELSSWSLEICANYTEAILAPSALTATLESGEVTLSWDDNSLNEESFILERSVNDNLSFVEIATLPENTTNYIDNTIEEFNTYFYRVKATGGIDESNYSNEAVVAQAPAAPSDLILTEASENSINVSWSDNSSNEDGFILERSGGDNLNYLVVDSVDFNVTSFTDQTITIRNTYFYRVSAFNSLANSNFSNEQSLVQSPEAPSQLTGSANSVDQIDLVWNDNALNESMYTIERSLNGNVSFQEIAIVDADQSSYSDLDLEEPGNYFYRVKASNSGGESIYSNEAIVSTLVLGLSDDSMIKPVIYPNPGTGIFTLSGLSNHSDYNILINDLLGNQIKSKISSINQLQKIDLSNEADGIYVVTIIGVSSNHIIRVMKNKNN